MIADTVRYLKSKGREVLYDAEHFFDSFREDPEYSLATIKGAISQSISPDHQSTHKACKVPAT